MALTTVRTHLRRVGEVDLYDVRLVVSGPDTTLQYPQEAGLKSDKIFRKVIGSVFQWRNEEGLVFPFTTLFPQVSLVGPTGGNQAQITVFRRVVLQSDDPADPATLQSDEYRSGSSVANATVAKWMDEQFPAILPPGTGIEIEMTGGTIDNAFIAFSCMLAEARDPSKLWPVIGGLQGQAGPQVSAFGE